MSDAPPRGKEAVRRALIEAAIVLFAERGPEATSVRDVAAAAGVNHGLVHRHFGSKGGLVQAVMDHLAEGVASGVGRIRPGEALVDVLPDALRATAGGGRHWRILAWLLLEGADPMDLQAGFPTVTRLLEAARRDPSPPASPEGRVALATLYALGIQLFGPFAQTALELDDEAWARTRQEMNRLVLGVVAQPGD